MATTTYGVVNQRTAAWAATEMLAHAEPIEVLSRFGQNKPIPKNKADNAKFRRPIPFAVATTALTEGVTPTAGTITYEDVSVTLAQYGHVVEITDVVADVAEDPVLKDASMLCGEQAAETIELLLWNVLRAGTNVVYSNGATRNAVNTAISTPMQRGVTRTLKGNRARKLTSMLSGSQNYDTTPVDAAYVAFGHTDLESDIRDMTGFVPVERYGSMKALPFEIGKVEDVRYILTPVVTKFADAGGAAGAMVSTTGTSADVYPIVYVSKDAYGLTPLRGAGAIKPSVLNPGDASKSDPLGQVGYVGWKTWFAAVRLNETWMVRGEVAATDL